MTSPLIRWSSALPGFKSTREAELDRVIGEYR
jgi:hypothetical protein